MVEWFTDNGLLLGLALLDGLAYAALVFMVAVGLNMVFGVLRIVNVAHGSLFAIGAYTAASVGISYWMHRTGHHRLERWVSIVHIGVTGFGVVRNYTLDTYHTATVH